MPVHLEKPGAYSSGFSIQRLSSVFDTFPQLLFGSTYPNSYRLGRLKRVLWSK